MGTRGLYGFTVDGKNFLAYNQYDSYPDGLGKDTLTWLIEHFYVDVLLDRLSALGVEA